MATGVLLLSFKASCMCFQWAVVARTSKFEIPVVDPCHLKTNRLLIFFTILAQQGLKLLQTPRQKKHNASNTFCQLMTALSSTNDGTSVSINIIIIHHRHQKAVPSVSSWVSPPDLSFSFFFSFCFRRLFFFFGFLGCPVPFSHIDCIELTQASRDIPDSSRCKQTATLSSLHFNFSIKTSISNRFCFVGIYIYIHIYIYIYVYLHIFTQ